MELLAAYQSELASTTREATGPRPSRPTRVTEDFLEILGGEPVRGRGITEEDLDPDGEAVVVLTHGFWQRAFGGDPGGLGATMVLDGVGPHRGGGPPGGLAASSRTGTDLILPLKPRAVLVHEPGQPTSSTGWVA